MTKGVRLCITVFAVLVLTMTGGGSAAGKGRVAYRGPEDEGNKGRSVGN